jgi:hypothetical protein
MLEAGGKSRWLAASFQDLERIHSEFKFIDGISRAIEGGLDL